MKKAIIDYTSCQNQYQISWVNEKGISEKAISETYRDILKEGKILKEKGIVDTVENKIFSEHSI